MKYSSSLLSALALAPAVLGQSSSGTASASASAASGSAAANGSDFQAYVQTLLGALNGAGLTTLADIATQVAGTPEGAQLLSILPQGNKTVFAPSNDAFAAIPESISSNVTALTQILSYHITERAWLPSGVSVSPQHSIAHTYLNGGMYTLPNNRTAPLVLERESANATTIRVVQGNITQAQGPVAAANLQVYIIDEVLSLPGNLTTVLTDLAPAFAQIVPEQVVTALQESTGFTVFVPNSEAISAAGSLLGQLNDTTIQNVLFNHVINGSVAYSTTIASGVNLTSAGGQPFMFMTNGTGTFVTSGNSTAQIVAPDIILENGVAHVINGVLANTASDTQAAGQAQESQASQIATQTEPTTPATQTSDPSNTQGSGGGSGGGASGGASAAPSGAASPMAPLGLSSTMLGGALGVVAAVAGGAFVLF